MAVTITDVARAAGVSISTVSKVMSGSTRISPQTQERVREAMERLAYHPNESARALARRSGHLVALLMELETAGEAPNPYTAHMLAGVEEALDRQGYRLLLVNVHPSRNLKATLDRLILAQCPDGVLAMAGSSTGKMLGQLNRHQVPTVLIGEPVDPIACTWVDGDNVEGGRLAARHLAERGKRRIAFLGLYEGDSISRHRLQGCQEFLSQNGLPADPRWVVPMDRDAAKDAPKLDAVLDLPPGERPDGFIGNDNFVCAALLKAAQRHALRVPQDLALIGFDDYPLAPYLDPPLTVVRQDLHGIGREAALALLNKLAHPDRQSTSSQFLHPSLSLRAST